MAALRQGRYEPLPDWKQALLIFAVSEGFFDGISSDELDESAETMYDSMEIMHPELVERLKTGAKADEAALTALREALSEVISDAKSA